MTDAASLAGKVAVVTGATSGIGREICLRFARAGAHVVAAGRRVEAGALVVSEIEGAGGSARFVATDVSDPAAVERLIAAAEDAFGRVDVLVSSAGSCEPGQRRRHRSRCGE